MAPQFELVDPAGQNYDLQSNNGGHNGFSQQVFDGRQPLWERGARQTSYEPSYFQFDGFSNRDGRLERANDYRNSQTFDNPYKHLQNAHQTASIHGAQAAMRDYGSAIAAADRIDQRQVARDIERADRALVEANDRMMVAQRRGASRQQMQELHEQRETVQKEQQFLDSMRMAPVYARANAALCFIAKGDNQTFSMGERLLRQAVEMSPDIEWNYYFNQHRDRAYMEHNRRLSDDRGRRYPTNTSRSGQPLDVNPYEPQVPSRNDGSNQGPAIEPRPPLQRPPVGPQRPPVGPQRPLEQPRPPAQPRPPEQQNPPAPQRPPEQQNPPAPQRPPEQIPPKPPEQQRPPVVTDPKPNPTEQPAKPFDHALLAPSGSLYSPAGPPGLGESAPGETFSSEKDGKGGWDIDWRELTSKKADAQGNITYAYKGEIDDSSGWFAGLDGDTNFTAEETWSSLGQMLKRVMKYDGSLTFKVKTDGGPREIKDVQKITTTYNEATKKFETEMECTNGAIYKAETDLTGKVTKFSEVQTKVNDEAPGLPQANVGNFSNKGDTFHVARPVGIGGAVPGWAGDDNDILDFRKTQVTRASNGNITYKYEGEIEDSSGLVFGMNGDTNFEGQEILDSNNNLVSSFIKYASSKDLTFIGMGGQPFSIADVRQVRTNREGDGSFTSTVTDEKGTVWTFKSKSDGTVTEVR